MYRFFVMPQLINILKKKEDNKIVYITHKILYAFAALV